MRMEKKKGFVLRVKSSLGPLNNICKERRAGEINVYAISARCPDSTIVQYFL